MDFKSLIDFNKYIVALAAACFVYTLEKFVPAQTLNGRMLVLGLPAAFFLTALTGVIILAACTAALHGDQARQDRLKKQIGRLGIAHLSLLCIGMVVLGGMLVPRVLAEAEPAAPQQCCCTQTLSNNGLERSSASADKPACT